MYLPMPKTMAGYDLVPYFTSITDFKLRFSTLPITSLALITELGLPTSSHSTNKNFTSLALATWLIKTRKEDISNSLSLSLFSHVTHCQVTYS